MKQQDIGLQRFRTLIIFAILKQTSTATYTHYSFRTLIIFAIMI